MEQKSSQHSGPELPAVVREHMNANSEPDSRIEMKTPAAFERQEQQSEQPASAADDVGLQAVVPDPILSVQPVPASDGSSAQSLAGPTPLVANDDELIEKEWVIKAKKVITETKDDPYRREKEINLLQADYIKKRYGRELGASR